VAQLQAKHPTLQFPPIPERGNLALYKVKHSKYFFS
jgi:DNA-directed RNA polymerase